MRHWYYSHGSSHYYGLSNALDEYSWYRFDAKGYEKTTCDQIDVTKAYPIMRGCLPKVLRRELFLREYGDAWLEALIEQNKLVFSVRNTLDLAVFKLGRPILDLYELPEAQLEGGTWRRWKANHELIEQYNGGTLQVKHLTKPRPRDLDGPYGQFYRIPGFATEPNVYFYLFEEWDGVHKVRYEIKEDGTTEAMMVCFDVLGYPTEVCDARVPLEVRAKRFVLEHGVSWLNERRPTNDGPLSQQELILMACYLNRPIWPWEIAYVGDGSPVKQWIVDDKKLVSYCPAAEKWPERFLVDNI